MSEPDGSDCSKSGASTSTAVRRSATTGRRLIAGATELALAEEHRLLVIDTFPGLAGLGDEQENDAGAITSRLQPLQVAAGAGLAVLFLHHMNNANQPRGSKAFRGVVDTSIRFLRKAKSRSFRLETETRSTTSVSGSLRAELIQASDGWFYRALDGAGSTEAARANDRRVALASPSTSRASTGSLTRNSIGSRASPLDIAKRRLPSWNGDARQPRWNRHEERSLPLVRPPQADFGAVRKYLKEVKTPNP